MQLIYLNLLILSTSSPVFVSWDYEALFPPLPPSPPSFSGSSWASLWHSKCWQDRLCPLWSGLQCCGNNKTTQPLNLPGLLLGARWNGPKPDQRNSMVLLWNWSGLNIRNWKALQIYKINYIRRSLLRIHVLGMSSTGRLLIQDSPMRFIRWKVKTGHS